MCLTRFCSRFTRLCPVFGGFETGEELSGDETYFRLFPEKWNFKRNINLKSSIQLASSKFTQTHELSPPRKFQLVSQRIYVVYLETGLLMSVKFELFPETITVTLGLSS